MAARFAIIAIVALCLLGTPTRAFSDGDGTIPPVSAGSGVLCGSEGKRVQAVYVRTADKPDHYADFLFAIRKAAHDADLIFDASAHLTGGHRHVRWVTTADCEIDVANVLLLQSFDSNLQATMVAMQMLGYDSNDRKYMMFIEANVYCGKGSIVVDDSPGLDNLSNHVAGYARVDFGCWNGRVVAHELVHMLGGVQPSAPHSSGAWHVIDSFDIMAHSDPPNYASMIFPCLGLGGVARLDCNGDDYFNTSPEPGSYLATHWNVADSDFLTSDERRVYLAMVMQ